MLSGDFLMRQVHQLAQVLARVLARRQSEQPEEALAEIAAGWRTMPGLDGGSPLAASRETLLAACSDDAGRLHAETALLAADLLEIEGDLRAERGDASGARAAFERARWLLEAASRVPDAAMPIDLFARLARLAERSA